MGEKIIYPSIDLFLYDLKNGLGQDEEKASINRKQFCKKVYPDLDNEELEEKSKQIEKYQNAEVEFIELLDTRTKTFELSLDGYYYPLQLGDTYALLVDYSGELNSNRKPNYDPQDIDNKPFTERKKEIKKRINEQTGTIGQTWLLWGKLADAQQNPENIAKECYTQLFEQQLWDWDRDFIDKGELLGGTLFELWYCPTNLGLPWDEFWQKFRKESHHILIWLFPGDSRPAEEISNTVKSTYFDFLRLFHYRHKIVWAYYQSRYQKAILKRESVEMQPSIRQSSQLPRQLQNNSLKLSQLQETLADNLINLSDYTIALNALENQKCTIRDNLYNYQSRLEEMIEKYKKYVDLDLEFLKLFSEKSKIYAQKYQRQVEADHASLSPGLTRLQNLNSTIQGIIDLEQTKSDRNLNTTIAVVGLGLATSQIASAVIVIQPPGNQDALVYRTKAFVNIIGIGAIFIFIFTISAIAMLRMWATLRRLRRWMRYKKASQGREAL